MQVAFDIHARPDDRTFEAMRNGGAATGEIWLELGPHCFPAEGWRDFIVVLLTWWMHNVILLADAVVEVENLFMDGCRAFNCRRSPASRLLQITCYRDDQLIDLGALHVSRTRYVSELARVTTGVLREIRERGLHESSDVQRLERQLNKMLRVEARRRREGCW